MLLRAFEDGHRPGGGAKDGTRLALPPSSEPPLEPRLQVFEGVLGEAWRQRAYDLAARRDRPWGAYVTAASALDPSLCAADLFETDPIQAIALEATRALLYRRGAALPLHRVHGTAVWCLVSDERSQVQYHMDYAELYRYETDVVHPPLIAGTVHLSPVHSEDDMQGGEFMANAEGLAHYARFGYKARLLGEAALRADLAQSPSWRRVPYRCDRGILHPGSWPHLSSEVTRLAPGIRRVVLGLNAFEGEQVGLCCSRAPEHSDAFNRTVKLYQVMYNTSSSNKGDGSAAAAKEGEAKGVSAAQLMGNRALAKLLVLAARKVKQAQLGKAAPQENIL